MSSSSFEILFKMYKKIMCSHLQERKEEKQPKCARVRVN